MKESIKLNIGYIIIAIIAVIILFLIISVQPINARPDAKYDDALMINLTKNILEGKWLGEYNNITLVKGVFTPIFIAVLYFLNIPFLFGQMCLYIISIVTFIIIISKIIKNKSFLLIIFIYLIFNPVMYSSELCRVYRDGIYTSLIIFMTSFFIAIFLNRRENYKKIIKHYIFLGISVSAIWNCREETIWIFPFLIFISLIIIFFIIYDKLCEDKVKKLILFLIPIGILIITNLTICALNYKNYGVFMRNQYWSKEFKEAYGSLTRIKSSTKYDKVPITKDMLMKAYEVSPTFSKLKEYFKLTEFRWSRCGDGELYEIQGGWFHWALMNGVESIGYYSSAQKANEFYKKVAQEINQACNLGKIECYPYKIVSNVCKFDILDIIHVIKKVPNTIEYEYTLKNLKFKIDGVSEIPGFTTKEFLTYTNERVNTDNTYDTKINKIRLNIMEKIHNVYKYLNSIIFYMSTTAYVIIIVACFKSFKKYYKEFIILSSVLILYFSRIFIITFTSEFMWTEALNSMYMSCIYPIQYIFSFMTIYFSIKIIRNKFEKEEEIILYKRKKK